MNIELSADQILFKDTVDRLFADKYTFDQRARYAHETNGWSKAFWAQLADLGLLSVPFDEAYGGFGRIGVEAMIFMEAYGRSLALEPYLASVVLGGGTLQLAGSEAQRDELLPRLIAGDLHLALAHSEPDAVNDLSCVAASATRTEQGWLLSGQKRLALNADSAEFLIVSARTHGAPGDVHGISLFLVPSDSVGVVRHATSLLGGLRAADITLEGSHIGRGALIGTENAGLPVVARLVERATAMIVAEAVGAMSALHAMTLEYLRTRRQFGMPLASFQALQHRAVDMYTALEQSRSMMLLAALAADSTGAEGRSRALSAAKVQMGRAARFIGQQAVQLHGGIGMTMECAVGHYFRRLTALDMMFGSADLHLQRLARPDDGLFNLAAGRR